MRKFCVTLSLLIQNKCLGPLKNTTYYLIKLKCIFLTYLSFFCSTLLAGKSSASKSTRVIRLKNSVAQDIVYYVSGGKIKTPKSVLFPAVVKSLCNNVEVIKLINNYGHGVSYNLIEEIETEHALIVINQQKEKKVLIPEEAFQDYGSCCVGLMGADNIINLECNFTGSGTFNCANPILVQKKVDKENTVKEEEISQSTKRKCLLSLPADAALREISEYYAGKQTGPGELRHIGNLDKSSRYKEHNYYQKMSCLVWIEVRKLRTHPALLVPGWKGFQNRYQKRYDDTR